MAIFLDTGFYLGLAHPQDANRDRSLAILDELNKGTFGQLFTSNYVVTEAVTLSAVRSRQDTRVMSIMRNYFIGELQIATIFYASPQIDAVAWDLFVNVNSGQKGEKIISFIDCSNVIFCQQHQIPSIVAFDKHYERWLRRVC